ncbi:MAG TPA: hypothetical protein VHH92_07200 [Actinomycetota bacterium]|nr:hypothetical protein [Actinomycetota bacterium]
MFRRRARDDVMDPLIDEVERAKEELVSAVPSPRGVPGRPVAEALLAFEERLRSASSQLASMDGVSSSLRRSLENALTESLRRAERVRLEAPPLDYETLVTLLGDLMAPLDAFGTVDRG